MSRSSLMADLQTYIGHAIIECADAIEKIAKAHRYSLNIIDPDFNIGSIDNDESRLNVRTNRDGVVISFSIG
jgi:hypothetical protein